MSGITSKGYPYAVGADTIADYPTTSQALATKLDATIPVAIAAGNYTTNANLVQYASVATVLTFPVGRFTAAPLVMATMNNVVPGGASFVPRAGLISPTGFTAYLFNAGAATGNAVGQGVSWSAVQMLVAAGPGRAAADELPTFTATCDTPDCPQNGAVIDSLAYDPGDPPTAVYCGVCGQPITNVVGL